MRCWVLRGSPPGRDEQFPTVNGVCHDSVLPPAHWSLRAVRISSADSPAAPSCHNPPALGSTSRVGGRKLKCLLPPSRSSLHTQHCWVCPVLEHVLAPGTPRALNPPLPPAPSAMGQWVLSQGTHRHFMSLPSHGSWGARRMSKPMAHRAAQPTPYQLRPLLLLHSSGTRMGIETSGLRVQGAEPWHATAAPGLREGWGSSALCRASRTQGAAADLHSFPAGSQEAAQLPETMLSTRQDHTRVSATRCHLYSSPYPQPCAVGPAPQAAPHARPNGPRTQHSLPELLQSSWAARQDESPP